MKRIWIPWHFIPSPCLYIWFGKLRILTMLFYWNNVGLILTWIRIDFRTVPFGDYHDLFLTQCEILSAAIFNVMKHQGLVYQSFCFERFPRLMGKDKCISWLQKIDTWFWYRFMGLSSCNWFLSQCKFCCAINNWYVFPFFAE